MCDVALADLSDEAARTRLVGSLACFVGALELERCSGKDASRLLGFFVEVANLAEAGKVLSAARALKAHEDVAAGACSPAQFLAEATGTSLRAASGLIETAGSLAQLPLVEAAALRRGAVEPGETCELAGIGPVPVATARALLGDAVLDVVISNGVDVGSVTSLSRTIPRPLRLALVERDPCCVVPGCGVRRGLEIDHYKRDLALGGPTELANLARLCRHHHVQKTYRGEAPSASPRVRTTSQRAGTRWPANRCAAFAPEREPIGGQHQEQERDRE